jgi:hypothetical protein
MSHLIKQQWPVELLCRGAAYLNKRLHWIGHKTGRPVNRTVVAGRFAPGNNALRISSTGREALRASQPADSVLKAKNHLP